MMVEHEYIMHVNDGLKRHHIITTTITTAVNLSPPSSLSFPKLYHSCKVTLYAWAEVWAEAWAEA